MANILTWAAFVETVEAQLRKKGIDGQGVTINYIDFAYCESVRASVYEQGEKLMLTVTESYPGDTDDD